MEHLIEGRSAGAHVVSDGLPWSREQITLSAGQSLPAGAVLGMVTATKKYTRLDPAGSDGSETGAAVLFDNVDATEADTRALVHSGDCAVNGAELVWPEGIDPAEKAAAIAQLEARGLIVR